MLVASKQTEKLIAQTTCILILNLLFSTFVSLKSRSHAFVCFMFLIYKSRPYNGGLLELLWESEQQTNKVYEMCFKKSLTHEFSIIVYYPSLWKKVPILIFNLHIHTHAYKHTWAHKYAHIQTQTHIDTRIHDSCFYLFIYDPFYHRKTPMVEQEHMIVS